VAGRAIAAAPSPEDLVFFESKVRPLLIDRCLECHGEQKQKGGLRLDSAAAWRAGGDGGAVIQPGQPDASPLIAAVRYANEDLQMPPKERLSAAEVAVLEEWVRRGAPDPPPPAPATPVAGPGKTKDVGVLRTWGRPILLHFGTRPTATQHRRKPNHHRSTDP